MNGRVYDPLTAMFFSPDPFIQAAGDWKNYNRYSYCMNNPTRYTDPSGYQYYQQGTVWFAEFAGNWMGYRHGSGGGGSMGQRVWNNYIENKKTNPTLDYATYSTLWYDGDFVNGGRLVISREPNIVETRCGSYVSSHQQGWIVEAKWVDGKNAGGQVDVSNWRYSLIDNTGDLADIVETIARASRYGNIVKNISFVKPFINVMKFGVALEKDKNTLGRNTVILATKISADLLVGSAGLYLGQEIGGYIGGGIGFLFGGFGAIPGVMIGKAIGGAIGFYLSSSYTYDLIDEANKRIK